VVGEARPDPSEARPRGPAREGSCLVVEDVVVSYAAGPTVVDRVSFSLQAGEAVAIVGESGAGKTSLARALPGLLPRAASLRGSILLEGRELVGASESDLRAVRGAVLASILQEPGLALNPVRRAGAQIADVIASHRRTSRAAQRDAVGGLLQRVGLDPELARAYSHQLSGGQRQRVAIAQAIAAGPRVLIADEPTTALDALAEREIIDLLQELRRGMGLALLLVSHSLSTVARLADRILVMYAGRVVESGPVRDVLTQPLHPYTKALLSCLPPGLERRGGGARNRSRRLPTIPGSAPDPTLRRAGCAFEPRCPERLEACVTKEPGLCSPQAGRSLRCILYERRD